MPVGTEMYINLLPHCRGKSVNRIDESEASVQSLSCARSSLLVLPFILVHFATVPILSFSKVNLAT